MSTNTLLKSARFLAYAAGIACSFIGQTHLFGALLTGQGALNIIGGEFAMDGTLHEAAIVPAMAAGNGPAEFVIGIAFIFIGFLLHGLIGVREEHPSTMSSGSNGEHERAVRVTVAPKKPTKNEKWFWIEIHI